MACKESIYFYMLPVMLAAAGLLLWLSCKAVLSKSNSCICEPKILTKVDSPPHSRAFEDAVSNVIEAKVTVLLQKHLLKRGRQQLFFRSVK